MDGANIALPALYFRQEPEMIAEWETATDIVPGSPASIGRQLRVQLGGAFASPDARMLMLLEQLFSIPGTKTSLNDGR
jgi:hypothetical protein